MSLPTGSDFHVVVGSPGERATKGACRLGTYYNEFDPKADRGEYLLNPSFIRMLPEPQNELGYTVQQIQDILTPEEERRFWRWMRGQTMAITDGGEVVVYPHDFARWYEHKDTGAEPLVYD